MAAILVQEETADLIFVFQKLSSTLHTYTERYPELMYVTSGMKNIKQQTSGENDVQVLIDLSTYMKDKLSEYYAIKIMQHKLQRDIQALLTGTPINREQDLYLDFLGFKDVIPIK